MPECKLKELLIYFFPVDSFAAEAKRFSKVVKKYKEKKKTVEKMFISPQEILASAIWHPSQPLRTFVLVEAKHCCYIHKFSLSSHK